MEPTGKAEKYDHLVELSGSGFEISEGQPNIKGWPVENEPGLKIGKVTDLLFDPALGKVRYLVIDIDKNDIGLEDQKKVLVPIGVADLYNSDGEIVGDTVTNDDSITEPASSAEPHTVRERIHSAKTGNLVVIAATPPQINALPAYVKGGVTPEVESQIRHILQAGEAAAAGYERDNFYEHEHFNEEKFYQRKNFTGSKKLPVIEESISIDKRAVGTGTNRITSRIVERPVQETVTLKEQHISIQRNAVDRAVSAEVSIFQEEELEFTEYAEVPVVTKEARIVEEVEIHTTVEIKEVTVRDTLRNTEIETERIRNDEQR